MHSLLSSLRRPALVVLTALLLIRPAFAADTATSLAEARAEAETLKQKYTDTHPRVKEQQAKIGALERQLAGADAPVPAARTPEGAALAQARNRLLDLYEQGRTDDDNAVKQLKAEIGRLQYIVSAKADRPEFSPAPPVDIDFPGGSMSAFIEAIHNAGGVLNVIGEKSDLALELPPISLRNADAASLASALTALLQQRGYALQGPRTTLGQPTVYALRKLAAFERGNDNPQFQSFQLGPYLEHQSVDDVVAALRTAWELDPEHDAAALRLKFHPPTGILIVSAPREALPIVMSVLNQLRKGPEQKTPHPETTIPPARAEKK